LDKPEQADAIQELFRDIPGLGDIKPVVSPKAGFHVFKRKHPLLMKSCWICSLSMFPERRFRLRSPEGNHLRIPVSVSLMALLGPPLWLVVIRRNEGSAGGRFRFL